MKGIVFVYEEKRSRQNCLITVRIEERRRCGKAWVAEGPQRVYRGRDLKDPGINIMDRELFSLVFKSETELRRTEGRFFSLDEEYTLFRIAPGDLKFFLKRSAKKGLFCLRDGLPVSFIYREKIIPEIRFEQREEGFSARICLEGRGVSPLAVAMASNPVRILSGHTITELPKGLPVPLIRELMDKGPIPRDRYPGVLEELGRYAGKIRLSLPGKTPGSIHSPAMTPVLDFDPGLSFADLGFIYQGIGRVDMTDKRKVILDLKENREIHRDFHEEEKLARALEGWGAQLRSSARGAWFIPRGKREQLISNARKMGVDLRVSEAPLVPEIDIHWEVRADREGIVLGGSLVYDKKKTGLDNILDAHLNQQPWFDLPGDRKGLLLEGLALDLDQLALKGDFRDEDIRFESHDFPLVHKILGKRKLNADQTFDRYLEFLKTRQGPGRPIPVPGELKAELRPYQVTGFAWLAGLCGLGFSGILADDMGLGKTLQVLALLLHLKSEQGPGHKTLLILPKTLIWNWEAEIRRFAPTLRVHIHSGPARERSLSGLPGTDLVITSYGLARQDREILDQIPWDLIVLDEAQAIKNPKSQITLCVKGLTAARRLCLTGTPVENRPLDLWSQFDFLMPGFLGERSDFQQTYGSQDQEALNRLRQISSPFIMRRMKKEVCGELPPKTEITRYCDFAKTQRTCYEAILKKGKDRLLSGPRSSRSMEILSLLLRLRQAACHPALVPGQYSRDPGQQEQPQEASGKFAAVLDTALEVLGSGHKILIFSQFVSLLELAAPMFRALGIDTHTLYGTTTNREGAVSQFKESPGPCVFLISLKTGGTGLNLTQAGYVFLLDPWWNPAVEDQAIDRSHRIGQENPVTIYRFITRGSVEENVSRLQAKKRQMEKAVISPGEPGTAPFSEEELLSLIP